MSASALSTELSADIAAMCGDNSLERDRPSSRGTVVAVVIRGLGSERRLIVVTRERETAEGAEPLAPAEHRVYRATARRLADGWRMVPWKRAP